MKTVNRRLQIGLLVVFFCLLFTCGPAEAQTAKRLMLKDGSYQLASKWEVTADRVRYFSTERNEWEEVPASMVDWQATESFEKQRESQRKADLKQSEEDEEPEAKVPARPVIIAPGLHLPASGGVYLLDRYNGELQLTALTQSSGEVNRPSSRNILGGIISPIVSSKQSIELKGEHARAQSHLEQPAIFIDIDQDPAAKLLTLADRFRIARLEPKKDARLIGSLKVDITGKVNEQEFYLPSTTEQLANGWIKLTPSQPLSPGEYAVVEMLDSKTMNAYVWDFGVNPSSPVIPGWKAAPQSSVPAERATQPDIEKRPQ
jgi:hypothetical protein